MSVPVPRGERIEGGVVFRLSRRHTYVEMPPVLAASTFKGIYIGQAIHNQRIKYASEAITVIKQYNRHHINY